MREARECDSAPLREPAATLDVPVGQDCERSRQQTDRLSVGAAVERPAGSTLGEFDRVVDAFAAGCSLATVERDLGELRSELQPLALCKRLRGQAVQSCPATGAEACVHRVARKDVREPIAAGADLFDQSGRRGVLSERELRVVGTTRHRGQRRDVERLAEHCGGGERFRARRR